LCRIYHPHPGFRAACSVRIRSSLATAGEASRLVTDHHVDLLALQVGLALQAG
jgi:hypothetical protein